MNFQKIKNIIFDLGDVIINIDFMLTFKAFEEVSPYTLDETINLFEKHKIYDVVERGGMNHAEFADFLKNIFKLELSDEEILKRWSALLLDIPKERIDLIQELQQKYRIFVLSNTSSPHIVDVNEILQKATGVQDLKDLCEKAYYSYDIAMRKPDAEIYEYVLKDSNLKAEETLFLDDNSDNIVGAQKLGIHTILVQKPTCITEYLKDA
ncbi:MAG: HAD family phosphatase [Cytophagales bacterium]|nr:HAD family phosphatase [Cytophagales bacterium]